MDDFVSLLNTLEPGIVIFDKAFKIHYINRIVLILFSEVSSSEIFGGTLMTLHHKTAAGKITRMLDLLNTSKRQIPFSIKILSKKNNKDKYLFIKLISLLSDNLDESQCCVLLYDITAYISDKTTHLLKIPVGFKNEIKLIDLKDVVFVEADNAYSHVFTGTGRFFSGLSLGRLCDRLPHKYFYRIHRSYLVNLTKINKVWKERGAVYVSLQGIGEKLPVSRNKSRDFLKRMGLR